MEDHAACCSAAPSPSAARRCADGRARTSSSLATLASSVSASWRARSPIVSSHGVHRAPGQPARSRGRRRPREHAAAAAARGAAAAACALRRQRRDRPARRTAPAAPVSAQTLGSLAEHRVAGVGAPPAGASRGSAPRLRGRSRSACAGPRRRSGSASGRPAAAPAPAGGNGARVRPARRMRDVAERRSRRRALNGREAPAPSAPGGRAWPRRAAPPGSPRGSTGTPPLRSSSRSRAARRSLRRFAFFGAGTRLRAAARAARVSPSAAERAARHELGAQRPREVAGEQHVRASASAAIALDVARPAVGRRSRGPAGGGRACAATAAREVARPGPA